MSGRRSGRVRVAAVLAASAATALLVVGAYLTAGAPPEGAVLPDPGRDAAGGLFGAPESNAAGNGAVDEPDAGDRAEDAGASSGPAAPDGAAPGRAAEEGPRHGAASPAFLDVPAAWRPTGRSGGSPESWTYESAEGLEETAAELLSSLQSRGGELVSAGYLDLFGDSWGCAYAPPENAGSLVAVVRGAFDGEGGSSVRIVEVPAPAPGEAAS